MVHQKRQPQVVQQDMETTENTVKVNLQRARFHLMMNVSMAEIVTEKSQRLLTFRMRLVKL